MHIEHTYAHTVSQPKKTLVSIITPRLFFLRYKIPINRVAFRINPIGKAKDHKFLLKVHIISPQIKNQFIKITHKGTLIFFSCCS